MVSNPRSKISAHLVKHACIFYYALDMYVPKARLPVAIGVIADVR